MTEATPSDKLIVALDVPTDREALEIVRRLDGAAVFFKVGLELFANGSGLRLIDTLVSQGHAVFADFKFFDIPQTVYRAVRNLNGRGIRFVTVHAEPNTMQAAVDGADGICVLGVTVLTSLDDDGLKAMGHPIPVSELVQMRALDAKAAGCAGIISSPREVQATRTLVGQEFLLVTPGIRSTNAPPDDQKRTLGAKEALRLGADYLVVGRPIRDADDPHKSAREFQDQIREFELTQSDVNA